MLIARCAGIAVAAVLALAFWAPSPAHASGCTDTFTNTAGGSWSTGSNWSKKAAPSTTEEACITEPGTYTVTLSASSVSVKSLTLGGSSGTQTLAVESNCSGAASLGSTEGIGVGAKGAVTLTNGGLCANTVTLGGPVTNAGTITTAPGTTGGARNLEGNLTNTGTLAIDTTTAFGGSKATLTNEGAVDLAEGVELFVPNSGTFSNGAGGSISATGSASVFIPSGATFNEGAGTTSGSQPVIVEQATLEYTGSGASSIRLRSYYDHLSGSISPGQSLAIEACVGGGEPSIVDVAKSFANEGSLTVTSAKHGGADCGGNDYATLDVESGTLSNTGTIDIEPGTGGARTLEGGLTNKGTLAIDTTTTFGGSKATLANEGAVELGSGLELSVSNNGTFTNGTGGSIAAPGGANVLIPSGSTFNEGAGTTSGTEPVVVEQATLNYSGSGASSIKLRSYYDHLSGSVSPGQSLAIEACAGGGEPAIVDVAKSFANEGSLTVTSAKHGGADCGGNDYATLDVESGTLTNTGTIDVEPGTGGARTFEGSLTNKGTLAIDADTSYDGASAVLTNEGALDLAEGVGLSVSHTGSVVNGAGGNIAGGATGYMLAQSGTSFTEGAGTTSGTEPVVVEQATLNYTGSGASSIKLRSYYDHLSGSISPGQALAIEACVGGGNPAIVRAASGFANGGSLTVTSAKHGGADCGGNDYAILDVESGTLTNTGTIDVEPGIGGARTFEGSLTNRGTLAFDADTSYDGASTVLTNEGALDLAESVGLSVSNTGSVVNGAGGNIAGGATGYLLAQSGTSFTEGAGTTSGTEPVVVEQATLNYTGVGASSIRLRSYYDHLSGSISPGQALAIEACAGGGNPAIVDAASGFSNEGSLTVTSAKHNGADCGGNDYAILNLASGTLTNTGTIAVEPGTGGERKLEGSLSNDRLLSLGAGTTLKVTGSYTEAKAGTLETMLGGTSDFGALSVSGSATLAGTVLARQVNPFKGELGQKFAILTAASRSGSFGHTSGATIGPDLYYSPVNTATGTNLVVLEGESPEKVPTNVTKPTISGGTQQGQTIVLDSPGTWEQSPGEYSYQWLRCEASGANCQAIAGATGQSYLLTGADAGHRISLQAIAYNGAGESAPAEPSSPSPVISALPLHAYAGEAISAVEGASVTLDGSGSTPAAEITKYRWQFGDGAEEQGAGDAILHHTYAAADKYTARLTVFRGGEESSASVTITVTAKPKPAGGGHPAEGVYVTVKGTGDEPIPGASVLYVGSGGARTEAASGSSGEAVLKGLPEGTDTVYVYKSGLRPAVAQVAVNGEGDGSASVTLSPGETAAAEVKSKELDYEEIVAAGINPSEPANQNVYKFVIKLAFIESPPIEVHGYVNSGGEFVGGTGASGGGGGWSCGSGGCEGGGGGGGGGGGERIIAQPEVVQGHPLIQWLILHGKAAVLKQFFEVSMIVQNLSPEPFTLSKGTATLNLPEGLSLAPTTAQQALRNEVPAVPGGGSTTTNWIIRGDKPGEYNLSAEYKSTLEPFERAGVGAGGARQPAEGVGQGSDDAEGQGRRRQAPRRRALPRLRRRRKQIRRAAVQRRPDDRRKSARELHLPARTAVQRTGRRTEARRNVLRQTPLHPDPRRRKRVGLQPGAVERDVRGRKGTPRRKHRKDPRADDVPPGIRGEHPRLRASEMDPGPGRGRVQGVLDQDSRNAVHEHAAERPAEQLLQGCGHGTAGECHRSLRSGELDRSAVVCRQHGHRWAPRTGVLADGRSVGAGLESAYGFFGESGVGDGGRGDSDHDQGHRFCSWCDCGDRTGRWCRTDGYPGVQSGGGLSDRNHRCHWRRGQSRYVEPVRRRLGGDELPATAVTTTPITPIPRSRRSVRRRVRWKVGLRSRSPAPGSFRARLWRSDRAVVSPPSRRPKWWWSLRPKSPPRPAAWPKPVRGTCTSATREGPAPPTPVTTTPITPIPRSRRSVRRRGR